ncbi:MAG: TatD family hydrolase, partial [Candidatus Omnitrophota bacterium]
MPIFIDTHCHLDFPEFEPDRIEVIRRARQHEIGGIINIGSSLCSSQAGVDLARQYDFIFASVGIHPHDADTADNQAIKRIEQLSSQAKVVAIGEIGLDYYRGRSKVTNQKKLFLTLLELAKIRSLPVIIHCREALEDTLKILKDKNVTCGVLH